MAALDFEPLVSVVETREVELEATAEPCGLCGGRGICETEGTWIKLYPHKPRWYANWYRVRCTGCGARTKKYQKFGIDLAMAWPVSR